jgi:transcription elongation factor GreB
MRRVQRTRDVDADAERIGDRQGSPRQPVRERLALEVLHDEEIDFTLARRSSVGTKAADVVQGADVGVIECGNGLCFAIESLTEGTIGCQVRRQNLDGDGPRESRVLRPVHFTHPAGAKQGVHLVRAKTGSVSQSHNSASSIRGRRTCVVFRSSNIDPVRSKRPSREPVREAPGPKVKNYITPAGLQRLKDEHRFLMNRERPAVTQVVAWAASNGDRSENADYLYGKRRLRQIDSRIRFLTKRIDAAEVVDPAAPRSGSAARRVFFGATVTYKDGSGTEHIISIVGIDEVDINRRYISWMSPLARALMKSGPGDRVILRAPKKTEHLEILDVEYAPIPMDSYREPPGAEAVAR